jgi:Ferritin-like domain
MNTQNVMELMDPSEEARLFARRDAIRAGVYAGLAMGSLPMVLAAMAKTANAQGTAPSVTEVLNFALKLEYLEAEFYNLAVGATSSAMYAGTNQVFTAAGHPPKPVFDEIAKHENAHVTVLKGALGASAVAKPNFDFTGGHGATTGGKFNGPFADVFSNPTTFLALAQAFEDTGVRAYKGGAKYLISSIPALETALQIHSIEARHASKVRRIRGEKGWITGKANTLPDAAQGVYGAGSPAADYPAEDNVTQAGVNVSTLAGVAGANAASEAFDEPLDTTTVLAIAGLFVY